MAERYEHDDNHEYDILCVGFGPAGLSIAITLAEAEGVSKNGQSEKLSQENLRVCFVEKQPTFIWHEGMLLDDSKMQISFLKDLASMRDPRSYYTFLNYLHQKDRLLAFSNLGSFYPYRAEYNDYMAWAASHFTDVCRFGEQVIAIEPIVSEDTQEVERLKVTSKRLADGVNIVRIAKNVVVAVGGQPRIPDLITSKSDQEFEYNHRIIHSSQYAYRVSKTLSDKDAPYSIAVVGGGQSGAEIFYDLTNRYPNSRVSLILRDTALRPSDDSPFVNEIFDPSFTNTFYNMPTEKRQATLKREKATNYSVVRIELIERIYALLYKQKLPGQSEQHNILHSRRVLTVDPSEDSITLKLVSTDDSELNQENGEIEQSFDAVFFATGYQRRLHKEILRPMESYLTTDENSQMIIQRDYRVLTDPKCRAGIYLQGCCENTHGLSDSLLSVLPVRGVEVVQSLIEHDTELDRSSSSKSLEKELTSALQINGGKHGVDRYKSETCDSLPSPPSTRPLTPSTEDQMWQWIDGVDSNNANFGCLRYCGPSVDQVVSQDQNRAHPTRVPRPSSGQMLYRRHISALGQTISFRSL
ncbi:hypothetical protein K7432_014927 [Basidiobolus ranarum]|uniref:L-ornithine N(5)-monooxygenase [NAD(P)H] n=1 Tax=Basidiobolus ranarum TaxID=34480 RepID=A0ABR2WGW8_9FUNG